MEGVSFEFQLPKSLQACFLQQINIARNEIILWKFIDFQRTMNCWQPILEIRSSAFDLFCWALRLYTTWQVFDCTYADSTMLMGTFPIFVTFILHHGIQEERLIVMINMKDSLFAQDPFDYVINLDLLWQNSYLGILNIRKKFLTIITYSTVFECHQLI